MDEQSDDEEAFLSHRQVLPTEVSMTVPRPPPTQLEQFAVVEVVLVVVSWSWLDGAMSLTQLLSFQGAWWCHHFGHSGRSWQSRVVPPSTAPGYRFQ